MNWHDEIKAAQDRAAAAAAPYAPSMAQIEQALQPMVDQLIAMPIDQAWGMILHELTNRPIEFVGAWSAIVVTKYRNHCERQLINAVRLNRG